MDSSRTAKAPSEITIKRTVNGGHIVRHNYDNYGAGDSYMPPQEHAFSDHKSMMKHVHKHTGGKPGGSQVSTMDADHPSNTGAQTAQSHKPKVRPAHPGPRTRGAGVD